MKMKGPFLPSKQLLVFNGAYVLIAVVRSLHSAADFSGINLQSISFSCTGKYVATGGFISDTRTPMCKSTCRTSTT